MVLSSTLAGGRWASILLAASAFLMVFAAVPWMHDATLPKWGVVWGLSGIAGLWLLWRRPEFDRIDLAAALIVAWFATSIAWAPDRYEAVDALTGIAPVFLLFAVLRRLRFDPLLAVGGALLAVATHLALGLDPFGGFGNQNFLTEFILIAIPLLCLSWAGIVFAAAAAAYLILFVPSLLEWPIFALWGAAALIGFLFRIGRPFWAGIVCINVGYVAILGLLIDEIRWGVFSRLDLWAGTAAAWLAQPVWGHGAGSFDYAFPAFGNAGMALGLPAYSPEAAAYPGAAHNDILQLGMETGIVGFGLAAWLAWMVLRRPMRLQVRGALIAALGLGLIGFPFQNPATALLIALCAALASSSPAPPERSLRQLVALPVGAMAVAGAVFVLLALPIKWEAQKHLSAGMRYLQPETIEYEVSPKEALGNINAAFQLDAGNAEVRVLLFKAAILVDARHPGLVSIENIETAWRVAQTARPKDPGLLLARLAYLDRHGACPDLCTGLATMLMDTAWRKEEVQRLARHLMETNA